MKKSTNNHNPVEYIKELKTLKDALAGLSTRISKCEKNVPEETKTADSLVRGLAQLKGKYKEYENIYNDIIAKTGAISGLVKSAEEDAEKLRDVTNKIQDMAKQADEIKEAIEENPNILEDIEGMNEHITNVETLYAQAEKDKNEIHKLHKMLFGYNITNKETGEVEHKEGLKQHLDATYDSLLAQMASLEKNTKQKFGDTINDWESQYNALRNKVENLLPSAMSTGLAAAYNKKKKSETRGYIIGYIVFIVIILLLVAFAFVPVGLSLFNGIKAGTTIIEAIKDMPMITMALSPLYAALIWLGIFQNKKLNLSKKLIEEYSHKEVTAMTYAGLAKQVSDVGDDEMSQKLKIKLLEQTLDAAAKNPSDCITNHEKSDNPMMALLNVSAKWVDRAGGAENVAKLLTAAAEIYANVGKQKSEDACNLENDSEKE